MQNPSSSRIAAHVCAENTLELCSAIDLGSDGIELDVHLTRDGVPVVHHDESLKPAIDAGPTAVADRRRHSSRSSIMRNSAIMTLSPEAGSKYGARYTEQKSFDAATIPRLEDPTTRCGATRSRTSISMWNSKTRDP